MIRPGRGSRSVTDRGSSQSSGRRYISRELLTTYTSRNLVALAFVSMRGGTVIRSLG